MPMNARRLLRALACVGATWLLVPAMTGADPVERTSGSTDQERLNLTIYNGGNSLIHDRRRVVLDAGTSSLAWRDVSGQMDATSAILDDLTTPGATTVVEQNFDFDLLKPSTILDKNVGRAVTVVHDHPRAGQPASEIATLLADNDGVVLKYADRIETGLIDSHIVFPSIPEHLRDRPTLVLDLASSGGTHDMDLSYLTGGLGWSANYVGVVSPDESRMDIGGLVTLTNTTGTTYPGARLQLVAGNVHVAPPNADQMKTIGRVAAMAPRMQQQNFFEYHLYTLDRPTTVANAQTKQVSLLTAKRVPIHKTLELRGSDFYYYNANADLGSKLSLGVYITFANAGGDLGVPLPAGTFRFYKNDAGGTSQFLGSDTIDHTPRDQNVRLHLGDSFDVTANKKQTDFHGIDHCTFESSYAIALSNAKDVAQDVVVVEPIPGTWSIAKENHPHEKSSSATATWHLAIPSRETITLEYTARVTSCI